LPFLILGLATSAVLAQAHEPIASITNATWNQYRDQYQQSPICSKDEITLWTCETNKRVFSLCSSRVVTRTTGYLQYSDANGDASLEFTNNGYNYSLVDPLRGSSSIAVSTPGSSGKTTEIACGGNQTLQVNYTMRPMYDSGIWAGN
jgi:hypothetical protein